MNDDDSDVQATVRKFALDAGINYSMLMATHDAMAAYEAHELPTNVIIDADGFVCRRFIGARSPEVLAAMINEAVVSTQ